TCDRLWRCRLRNSGGADQDGLLLIRNATARELPMTAAEEGHASHFAPPIGGALAYAVELCLIGIVYFLLATFGLALSSINPSATPIWPPSGFALAAVL